MAKWDVLSAERFLRRNGVVLVGKKIVKPHGGIATWGAIDFLVNHVGYRVTR